MISAGEDVAAVRQLAVAAASPPVVPAARDGVWDARRAASCGRSVS